MDFNKKLEQHIDAHVQGQPFLTFKKVPLSSSLRSSTSELP